MVNKLDKAFAGFVAEGDEDYIGLWEIMPFISSYLDIDERKMTLAEAEKFWTALSHFIARMLNNGFVAVDLAKEGGYIAWPEQDPKQVMAIIRNKWVEIKGEFPDVGFIVWFNKVNKQPRPKKPKPI
jgi:hypothetical protein